MDDGRMEALAERQHGVVSHDQAVALGLTPGAVRHRRETGRWHDRSLGVYRVAGTVETPRQRAMAAVLGGGREAILSHTSTAGLLGLPGFTIDPIVITVPRKRRSIANVRIEQSLSLPLHHQRVVDSIPCTSVARTLFDLCGDIHARRAERALDNALARHMVTIPALWRVLDDLAVQGRAGTVLLRTLLTERGPRYVPPESELESRFLEVLASRNVREPARQVDLGDADSWIGRVDFVWRDERLIVEVDGAAFHNGFVDQKNDRERDERFTEAGWRVLRFGWDDVVDHPSTVADRINRALHSN